MGRTSQFNTSATCLKVTWTQFWFGHTVALVLVGAPGSGKSTVGRALAEELGVSFRDTDADIEAAAGHSVHDIFVLDGEERFRALEQDAVRDALAEHDGVLALGGGAVLSEPVRQALRGLPVVWLQVDAPAAVEPPAPEAGKTKPEPEGGKKAE